MITQLPDDIIYRIFLYVNPSKAYILGKTCRLMRRNVGVFYNKNADTLVKEGGDWHHCIKSKRTRASLVDGQVVSPSPMGVYSILKQECVVCKRPFKAAVHKDFGVIAHTGCIRPWLINIYYFEKFGLKMEHFEIVPHCELKGYFHSYGDRGGYTYTTVWKDKTCGFVPYEWTAHYLVHHVYWKQIQEHKEEVERQKEKTRIEMNEAKKQRAKRLRQLYNERIEKLMDRIDTIDKKQIKKIIATKLPHHFRPIFFGMHDLPFDRCSERDFEEAIYVIVHLHRLLNNMEQHTIYSLSYNDLKKYYT